jgi:hypothetical protein
MPTFHLHHSSSVAVSPDVLASARITLEGSGLFANPVAMVATPVAHVLPAHQTGATRGWVRGVFYTVRGRTQEQIRAIVPLLVSVLKDGFGDDTYVSVDIVETAPDGWYEG